MSSKSHPRVFISHASEDKDRFVLEFAKRLRANGVDAWVDQWEINPGDSLIDKIFEQGISEADAFIIVLSANSIQKHWVREELNAASIKRIEKNTKVIPIIIDKDLEVPEVLKTTVWETIENVNNYDNSFKKILASIYGVYDKPDLGSKPVYAVERIEVKGLSIIDSAVFKALGDEVFKTNEEFVEQSILEKIANQFGISQEDMIDSLEILASEFLLEQTKIIGCQLPMIKLSSNGVLKYAEHFIANFPTIYHDIISLIMNGDLAYAQNYASKLKCNKVLASALIEYFDSQGFVMTHNTLSHGMGIFDVTASGKRFFRQYLENN